MITKTLTAAAFALIAANAQAAVSDSFDIDTSSLAAPAATQSDPETGAFETAYYCEWITVYDYWGNWVTLWQCY